MYSVKPKSKPDEYTAFSNLLSRVVRVSGAEVKAKIEADKQARKQAKRASSRASRAKD